MATGRDMQLTKMVGEYLVSAELCRRGLITTTFAGNIPDFDIVAITESLHSIPVQVKASTKGDWHLINDKDKDQFYILQAKDLQAIVFKNYKEWLRKHNGKRPKNPKTMHTAIRIADISSYQDNWNLFIGR